jgi:hypothetical protein
MDIAWGDLGLVLIVGIAAACGIVTLFSLGLAVLAGNAPPDQRLAAQESGTPADKGGPPLPATPQSPAARILGWTCVTVCGLLVLYGIYLAIPNLHRLWS